MRCGGSALEGLLISPLRLFNLAYGLGKAGIGGGCSLREDVGLDGDWSLNVLSVIDPELPWRRRVPGPTVALPFDDTDAFRRIRFVCTSLTGVGLVVWVRSAAAAAADERATLEARFARKACAAAVAAAGVVGVFRAACEEKQGQSFRFYSSV